MLGVCVLLQNLVCSRTRNQCPYAPLWCFNQNILVDKSPFSGLQTCCVNWSALQLAFAVVDGVSEIYSAKE